MDNNISEKLNKILSDPEGMNKIMALAKSLSESENDEGKDAAQSAEQTPTTPSAVPSPLTDMLKSVSSSPAGRAFTEGSRERIQLLKALEPYLGGQKKEKLSRVISAMESAGAISSLTKLL